MSNLGRILTIRVVITDPEKAKWIWDAHMGPDQHGVKVEAIAEGDVLTERDSLMDEVLDETSISIKKRFYIREEGEGTKEAIDAHCYDGFETAEEAAKDAPKNVSPGAKWDIIDRNGKVYVSGVAP